MEKVVKVNQKVESYLTEGTLTEQYLLDNISRLMGCLRESNTVLRWVILHTAQGIGIEHVIVM